MTQYVLLRLRNIALVLLGLSLFAFMLLHIAPGSPVDLLVDEYATMEQRQALERKMGLDQPLPVQFARFLGGMARGDLGQSLMFQQPALSLILERFPATLELALMATGFVILFALPLGILVALKRQTIYDYGGTLLALIGISAPGFWLGIMLILVFAVELHWVASSGRGPAIVAALVDLLQGRPVTLVNSLRHLILPTITLGAFGTAFLTRLTRGNLLEELSRNYVRAARARGLPYLLVVTKHAMRNALMPVVTVLGLEVGTLVGGAIIIETVFAWPGVGQLIYQAISGRDYPLAQAGILFIGALVVALTFLVDVAYTFIDPRVRLGGGQPG